VAAEWVFAEGVTDETEEAVEALWIDDDEDASGRREAEHGLVGVGGGEELLEQLSGTGEAGKLGGSEFNAATIAQDDGAVERGGGDGGCQSISRSCGWRGRT